MSDKLIERIKADREAGTGMKLSELILDTVKNDDAVWSAEHLAAAITARLHECVKPLEWDFDGRILRMDDTMLFGKGYDWEAWECLRQEGYGIGCGYIIWPDTIGGARWNLYGTYNGLFVTDIDGEEAAKAAAQADYAAQIIGGLDL